MTLNLWLRRRSGSLADQEICPRNTFHFLLLIQIRDGGLLYTCVIFHARLIQKTDLLIYTIRKKADIVLAPEAVL